MAKLKMFTGLDKKSWDTIEKFNKEYEENSKFSSIQYRGNEREINMFNFERDYPQKICRTFCKCGNVETSSVKSCPVCGNDKIARYSYLNGYKETEYGNIVKIEKTANKVNIKLTKYDVVINSTNEIEIVEEPERLIATIRNDSADIRYSNECSKLGSSIFEEIPFTYDGFEFFGEKNNLLGLQKFLEAKKNFPAMMKDIHKSPNLVNYILSHENGVDDFKKIKNFEEIYDLLNIPDKRLIPYIGELYSGRTYYYSSYYRSKSTGPNKDVFDGYKSIKSQAMRDSILYMFSKVNMDINTVKSIISLANSLSTEADEIVLSNFIKNNFVKYGVKIIDEYNKRVQFLRDKGLDIDDYNLDTRNFNILKNMEYITKEIGYNEKKTSYFMELFDLNPLESLSALESRRAPNKAQVEEMKRKLD